MRSISLAAVVVLLAFSGTNAGAWSAPHRLLIVVDGPIRGIEAQALDEALKTGLGTLPKGWRVAVVGARSSKVETSPFFMGKDLRAIRNAVIALAAGDVRLGVRFKRALSMPPS
ncbi:MAG: hypothetical protein JRH20_32530, partial [Deltaproteobacteria bacterium]|nr:hypothetical protein [Deltaproteobacteria bacterium]